MTRLRAPALAVGLAALGSVVACSGPSAPTAASSTTATPTGNATQFDRLGYRFVVPQDWIANEGYLDWDDLDSKPHRGTPAFDTFASPDSDPWIVVGSRRVDGASLDQWIDELRSEHVITYEPDQCGPVEDERTTTLGGEPAQMLAFHCPVDGPDAVAAQVLARHEDTGWVVMCYSETGRAGALAEHEQQCERWLSSFEFAT
jgi:hypothetical protein